MSVQESLGLAKRVDVARQTGILFTHWIADSLTLWKAPVTNEHIWTAASYYSLFAKAPANLGYALAAVVTLGAATILWSFGDGAAGNLMFDGASICTCSCCICCSWRSMNEMLTFFISPVRYRGCSVLV